MLSWPQLTARPQFHAPQALYRRRPTARRLSKLPRHTLEAPEPATMSARSRITFAIKRKKGENQMSVTSNLDTAATALETAETPSLIGSDKVAGTAVYDSEGDKMGRSERVMIGKYNGKAEYAVMSFGGFMGFGEDYYPLPWKLLTYNPQLGGYQVNIAETQLKGAPRYSTHETWDWSTRGHAI